MRALGTIARLSSSSYGGMNGPFRPFPNDNTYHTSYALILLGCLMDSLLMILLAIPFFWPVLVELNGEDGATTLTSPFGLNTEDRKIWFGILTLIIVELGLIAPPVGMNVYHLSSGEGRAHACSLYE